MSSDNEPKIEYGELKLARGLVFLDGHVLLAKNNFEGGHYFLPGGKVDPRESVMTALVREFEEELGWRIAVENFVGCFENLWPFEKKKTNTIVDVLEINFLFTLRRLDGEVSLKNPESREDKISFEWISLQKLADIHLLPEDFKEILPRLQSAIQKNTGKPFWGTTLKPQESGH